MNDMNDMKTNVDICQSPMIPAGVKSPIKSLVSDIDDLANTAYARVARVNLEVLGIDTPDPPDPMACSMQEALEAHRAVLVALCDRLDVLIQGLGV